MLLWNCLDWKWDVEMLGKMRAHSKVCLKRFSQNSRSQEHFSSRAALRNCCCWNERTPAKCSFSLLGFMSVCSCSKQPFTTNPSSCSGELLCHQSKPRAILCNCFYLDLYLALWRPQEMDYSQWLGTKRGKMKRDVKIYT